MSTRPNRSVTPTRGSDATEAARRRIGGDFLARKLGVSDALLRAVAKGQRTASPELQTALERDYQIPSSWWSLPSEAIDVPVGHPETAAPQGDPPRAPRRPSPVASSLEEAEKNVARLRRQAAQADSDPNGSARDRAALGTALSVALVVTATLRGEIPWR